ncbi:MAG: hypothetical protein K2Q45_01550 [Nitrosomonas sp.]|nr:hypothetical protein [Nitrosomonas sp.]
MEWFKGILLPKGFKDLEFRNFGKVFRHIDLHLGEFADQPITLEFHGNEIIGKIKSVWMDSNGEIMIAGFLTQKCKHDGLAIIFNCTFDVNTRIYEGFSNFGVFFTRAPYFKECRVLERKEIKLPHFL